MAKQFVQRMDSAGKAGEIVSLEDAEVTLKQDSPDKFQDFDSADVEGRLNQVSGLGTFLPVAAPSITDTPANLNVSDGADDLEDEAKQNENDISSGINDAEGGTDSVQNTLDELNKVRENINDITDEDLKSIEEAGDAAGAQFDQGIEEAEERRRVTLPAEVVRAGQKGGFLNTQQSGAAAIQRTDPRTGEAFVGAGGELDRKRQVLDRNVSMLKVAQSRAIEVAKAAQKAYIRTGKREDYNDAVDAVKLANDLKADAERQLIARENLFLSQRAEDRLGTKAAFDIAKEIPEGEVVVIDGQEFVGIAIPESEKAFFTGSNIISLMKELPEGQTEEITDPNTGTVFTITGLKNPDTVQATDDAGNLSVINKNTGEVISKAEGVGKTKTRAASTTVILNQQEAEVFGEAAKILNDSVGEDGKFDTAVFIKERERVAATPGGDVGKFDELFTPRLNENDPTALPFLTSAQVKVRGGETKTLDELIGESISDINIEIQN